MRNSILTISFLLLTSTIAFTQDGKDKKERRKGPLSIEQIFKDLDKNEDGKISLKEVKGPLKKGFQKN